MTDSQSPEPHGRGLSTELPEDHFDVLSSLIWQTAVAYCPTLNEHSIAPARVKLFPIQVGKLVLEAEVDFRMPEETGTPHPYEYFATISEVENYAPMPDSTLWSWRQVRVNTDQMELGFLRGTSIMTPYAEFDLEISNLDADELDAVEVLNQLNDTLDEDDFKWFVEKMGLILTDIRQQK